MIDLTLPVIKVNDTGAEMILHRQNTLGEECIADAPPGITPGETVRVVFPSGEIAGIGYFNRLSRLPLRVLSRDDRIPDRAFWTNALQSAMNFRQRFYPPGESYRVVFGEADYIPGLIVDKFGEILSVQLTTAGIEAYKEILLDVLQELFQPKGIMLSCDSLPRKKEGLPLYRAIGRGNVPDQFFAAVDGVEHAIDCIHGHKTGFFLDHRMNRDWASQLCSGKKVLDLFCYSGAFGIRAGLKSAEQVLCIDIFEPALKLGETTARLHGIEDSVSFRKAEAFGFLNSPEQKSSWDVIFLDPPSFVRGSGRAQRNQANYRKITQLALDALVPGGVLITSCCSFHVSKSEFLKTTQSVFATRNRDCRIFRIGCQSPDHPILPNVEGTDYLKCYFIAADR